MSKSLIKTVDGIGIWVRDDIKSSVIPLKYIGLSTIVIIMIGMMTLFKSDVINYFTVICGFCIMFYGLGVFIFTAYLFEISAYEVYLGSEISNGITIPKTTDPKADQLAICKAAREIESRCHEIAAKRAELDRIAKGCK